MKGNLEKAAIRALTERNMALLDLFLWHKKGKQMVDEPANLHKNYIKFKSIGVDPIISKSPYSKFQNIATLDGNKINSKYLAFYIGPSHQRILNLNYIEGEEMFNLGGVFFLTSLNDLKHSFDFENETMIYFTDLRSASGRVQPACSNKVMFQDKILKKIREYRAGKGDEKEVKKEISDWKIKCTIPFNSNRVERYKKQGNYVILDTPIKVSAH